MQIKNLSRGTVILISGLFILVGVILIGWLASSTPGTSQAAAGTAGQFAANAAGGEIPAQEGSQATNAIEQRQTPISGRTNTQPAQPPTPTATPVAVTVGLAPGVPMRMLTTTLPLTESTWSHVTVITQTASGGGGATPDHTTLFFDFQPPAYAESASVAAYAYLFAAAVRFDTIDPTISEAALRQLWQLNSTGDEAAGENGDPSDPTLLDTPFTTVAVLSDTLPALTTILGEAGSSVQGYATSADLIAAAWDDAERMVIIPFDLLSPRLAVLAIDDQTPVENANNFAVERYPLVTTIHAYLHAQNAQEQAAAEALLAELPPGNRDPERLTVIAMTGVTAMVRLTAAEMDQRGYAWPAEFVGPLLASADITAISNEVPFVPGCQTDTRMDNLTFCSKPEYMEALTASGVDIIGLTGNHQNDFGRNDAITSLEIYEAAGLPVYGGGRNKEEAFAPLYLEHNGNRLAFLGANSYGPQFAWATDDQPGSAEFDLNIMSATIRNIKQLDRAEVVLAELQYQETYDVTPLIDQRQNFNALVQAGADIVTGVQSHVPQAMEFTGGKLILYGLGNLFFDQMWSRATREGIIVKHTIYNNRHISTQVFTTLLYDYGQPQWTTPEEHSTILQRVFGASYW